MATNIPVQNIRSKIIELRGVQVMLDSDLAELYDVETRVLNQAVKRNIERFPEDFMFQLNEEEFVYWKSQIVISKFEKKEDINRFKMGLRKPPYAFTEQGVAMLSGILKSKKAVEVNVKIMRAFVAMRTFLLKNKDVFNRLEYIERKQIEYQIKTDKKFDEIFGVLKIKEPTQGVFYDGQVFDAFLFVSGLIKKAKKRIILIDNYVDENTLKLFSDKEKSVSVKVYTKNLNEKLLLAKDKFNSQFGGLEIIEFSKSHDRFLITDKEIYHFGASLKDLGKKWFAFSKLHLELGVILKRLR